MGRDGKMTGKQADSNQGLYWIICSWFINRSRTKDWWVPAGKRVPRTWTASPCTPATAECKSTFPFLLLKLLMA